MFNYYIQSVQLFLEVAIRRLIMPILQAEIKMKLIKTSIRIVLIAFIEIISFDRFYANRQGCFTVQNKNICYFQPIATSTHMTWDDAWSVCMENNATLPVIDNRMTTEALKRYMESEHSVLVDMWLAGREIRTDDWRWLNGKLFGRENSFANRDQPKNVYNTNAAITRKLGLQYMWSWAKYEYCYICKYSESELCQKKSTIPWKNGCLFVSYKKALNFMDSRNRCLDGGGDLATFEEDEDLEMLGNGSSSLFKCKNYWIGLRQNWWIWNETATSKEIKHSNWLDYQDLLNKHCLCIRLIDNKWDQSDCTEKKTFLCQTVSTTASIQGTEKPSESFSPTESPDVHTRDTPISKDLLLIIVGSVIAVAIVVVIIVVLVVVLKIQKNRQERGINLRANEKPTVRREMSAHRNENKSVKTKSIEDSEISNHYAEIPRAVGYDDNDECRDDPQPGIVYAALEFDANKAIYEEPDLRSQRKQEAGAPANTGALNKNVESPTQAAAGTIYANL